MKKGDRVYVNWPTGRGGPYRSTELDLESIEIIVDNKVLIVPPTWCEPAEPEIEENRGDYNENNNTGTIEITIRVQSKNGDIQMEKQYK